MRYILKTRGGAEGSEGIEDISEDKNKAKKPTGVSLREEVSRWHVQTELWWKKAVETRLHESKQTKNKKRAIKSLFEGSLVNN